MSSLAFQTHIHTHIPLPPRQAVMRDFATPSAFHVAALLHAITMFKQHIFVQASFQGAKEAPSLRCPRVQQLCF